MEGFSIYDEENSMLELMELLGNKQNEVVETIDTTLTENNTLVENKIKEHDAKINGILEELPDIIKEEVNKFDGDTATIKNKFDEINSSLAETAKLLDDICINVLEHGVVNDGITDNALIINELLKKYSNLYFPKGEYKINSPIIIDRENITIFGEGHIANSYTKFLCNGNSCFFIKVNCRYVNINSFQIINVGNKVGTCALMFGKETNSSQGVSVHFSNFENMRIDGFENGISIGINMDKSIATAFILWNVFFNKIRIDRCTNAILSNVSIGDSFGVTFEKIYANECDKPITLKSIQATFRDCNFGLKDINAIDLSTNSYVTFEGCNFECDYQITNPGTIMKFNGKSYKLVNCIFVLQCNATSYMIGVYSDLQSLTLDNCKQMTKTGNLATNLFNPSDCGCKNYAIKIIGGQGISTPAFPSAYTNKYIINNKMTLINDNCEKDNVNGDYNYNIDRGRPEIYYNTKRRDFLGNETTNTNFPIKIGGNKYLDSGEVTIGTNGVGTIRYNKTGKGRVILSPIPYSSDVITVYQDLSTDNDSDTFTVVRARKWNGSTWDFSLSEPIKLNWWKVCD